MKVIQYTKAALIGVRNMLLGGNLVCLALAAKPRDMISYVTDNLFSFRTAADRRGLPQKNVFDVFPQVRDANIRLINLNGNNWFVNRPSFAIDIVSLCLLCQAVKPSSIFEIGTFRGYSAMHMAANSAPNAKLYTLDLAMDTAPTLPISIVDNEIVCRSKNGRHYDWEGRNAAIFPLFGDSFTFDFSPYRGKIDLFFIDGAHSYEYVRSDTLNAVECCHPGSVIAWHDFGRLSQNGVSKWLLEFSKQHQIYSVPGGSLAFCVL